jgi:alanine racemase
MSGCERAGALLTVDLAALAANFRLMRDRAPGCEMAPALKADAYGLGAATVAPVLWREGARTFFVATLEEGVALRGLLPEAVIYVLSGPIGAGAGAGVAAEYRAQRLRPVLNCLDQVAAWEAEPAAAGLPLALHLDSGLHRLGLPPGEIAALAADPARLARLAPALVMSHFAAADDPASPMSDEQLAEFLAALERLWPGGRRRPPRSLAASSGLFRSPRFHLEMARPGGSLYGLAPLAGEPNPLAQVVRLQARILQIREIDSNRSVGYGATHRFAERGRLATVGAGYADGYLRSLSNRGFAKFGAHRLPVVGRVSMDLLTLDISAVPPETLRPGDLVDLIGPGNDVDAVSAAAGTVGWELLSRLGPRLARRYVGGAADRSAAA